MIRRELHVIVPIDTDVPARSHMRILHTADWHLGRIFYRTHLTEDQAHVLEQVIQLARDAEPDVVVVAGDIYDRAVPPPDAVRLLDHAVSEIVLGLGVPMIMISGNHDSPHRLGYAARMLSRQQLHVTTELRAELEPITLEDAHGPVDFWCVPYAEPSIIRQALPECTARTHDTAFGAVVGAIDTARAERSDLRRDVVVGHVHVEGGEECESERPLVFGSSAVVRTHWFDTFDYAALGHLHRPQNVGSHRVRYSGSILKYAFDEEADEKSVSIVDIDANGDTRVETIPLNARRDVVRVEASFEALLDPEETPVPHQTEDYLEISLTDTEAIVDAMSRLRALFPNVLHLRRPSFKPEAELEGPIDDHRPGAPLREAEDDALTGVLRKIDASGREVESS